jgi:CelD/BcsL family acetyltransferase involved in cellulose biosynthesis
MEDMSGDPAAGYRVEPVVTEAALDALEGDWNRLSGGTESPNVFMTYGWFRSWIRRLVQDERKLGFQPYVLVLKRGGEVVGISPLIRRMAAAKFLRMRKLEFATYHADYNDLVLGDDAAGQIEAVADFLARWSGQWDVADLRDVRDHGGSIEQIKGALTRSGLLYRLLPEQERCPYMPIDKPWAEMMMEHSRSTRRAYRRFIEMKAQGLKARMVEDPQNQPGLLKELIAVEAQKQVGGELSQPLLGAFPEVFQGLFDLLGPLGWIVVTLLEWEGRVIAWQILYRAGRKLWGYSTAYDHNFSAFSPGTAMVAEVVDYGLARGFDEFDFLRGSETYKGRWVTGSHHSYRLLIWNKRPMSRLRAFALLRFRIRPPASRGGERPVERSDG